MSWGYSYTGKLPAVRAKVQALSQTFTVTGEQEIFDASKRMVLASLDCIDDSKVVTASASGSAYAGDAKNPEHERKGGSVSLQVNEIGGFLE